MSYKISYEHEPALQKLQ